MTDDEFNEDNDVDDEVNENLPDLDDPATLDEDQGDVGPLEGDDSE